MSKPDCNFLLDITIDGSSDGAALETVGVDGGFELNVYMKTKGEVTYAGEMRGHAANGKLVLVWMPWNTDTDSIVLKESEA